MFINTETAIITLALISTGASLAIAALKMQEHLHERKLRKQKRQADHLAVLRFIDELRKN